MKLPIKLFTSSIKEQKILYFSSQHLNSDESHYFVCIKRTDNDVLILTCCTSKFDTVRKFVESRHLPNETLVWIKPDPKDSENPFTIDTYVNCNNVFSYTMEEFQNMYSSNSLSIVGELSLNYYTQIINGLIASPLIEEEIKDCLPKIDDL